MDNITNLANKSKSAFAIAIYSAIQRLSSPRVICLIIIFGTFVWSNMSFAGQAADITGLRINPFLYPFLASDAIKQLVIFSGVIFLYSDAPFISKNQPYVIIRSKRTVWAIGQIWHIIMFSALYFFILMSISFVAVLPYATLTTDGWGKLANIIVQSNLTSQLDTNIYFYNVIVSSYSPLEAFGWTFLLNWALASFFGLLIFAANLNLGKMIGPSIALAWMLVDLLVENYLSLSWHKFSPLTMSRLSMLDPFSTLGGVYSPSPLYALCFYCVGIIIFSAIVLATIKQRPIEISTEA